MEGHLGNVKCVEFLGDQGNRLVSGSRSVRCTRGGKAHFRKSDAEHCKSNRCGLNASATTLYACGTLIAHSAWRRCAATRRVCGTWRRIATATWSLRRQVMARFGYVQRPRRWVAAVDACLRRGMCLRRTSILSAVGHAHLARHVAPDDRSAVGRPLQYRLPSERGIKLVGVLMGGRRRTYYPSFSLIWQDGAYRRMW